MFETSSFFLLFYGVTAARMENPNSIDFEQFERLLRRLSEAGVIGQLPETNEDKEVTLRFAWSVLIALHMDQELSSYDKFKDKRQAAFNALDTPAHSIWLFLTPAQRSMFATLVTFYNLLQTRGLKRLRDDEDEDNDDEAVKYQRRGMRERARVMREAEFMFDELLPELRELVLSHMPLRPLLRFMATSTRSHAVGERVFRTLFYRDIVANIDRNDANYEQGFNEDPMLFGRFLRTLVSRLGPDGNYFFGPVLTEDETATLKTTLVEVFGITPRDEGLSEFHHMIPILVRLKYVVPKGFSLFQLYRTVMEKLADTMHEQYLEASEIARYMSKTSCVWVSFSTPRHGHLFDIRFSPTKENDIVFGDNDDPINLGSREFRALTVDPEAERGFAPLRDFYASRNRVFPNVVPLMGDLYSGAGEQKLEEEAFRNSILNLLYGLSPLLTMTIEAQNVGKPTTIKYLAVDTNGMLYTPEQYAVRSTNVPSQKVSGQQQPSFGGGGGGLHAWFSKGCM
jgi:hypothetical protein